MTPYTKVGCPICDAIIVIKCTLIFGEENHNTSMKAFFQSHRVPVVVVVDARRKGFIFLGLDDARN
jgi:PII-like signaling protein